MFFGKKNQAANVPPEGGDGGDSGSGIAKVEFSDADKNRARQWFRKGDENREKRDYDYAIEAYINGLQFWPEAVEEGHMKLRSIAVQRLQAGGKKPGMLDKMKYPVSGRDAKQAFLNCCRRVSLDITDGDAWDGLVKNAGKAGYFQAMQWAAPLALENLKRDAKPNASRFKAFREALNEASELAAEHYGNAMATKLLEFAMDSVDYLAARSPGDESMRIEQRNLASKLAIVKGKYESAEDFRESVRDSDKQKMLHDLERGGKQGDETLAAAIAQARKAWEQDPNTPSLLNQYIDALARTERKEYEDEAIRVLNDLYVQTKQYAMKVRADNILLTQRKRDLRALLEKARASKNEDDARNYRLSEQDYYQTELEILRERMQNYPTDLKLKYQVGMSLFRLQQHHEAIPLLQAAQGDPKYRTRAQLYMGRAFFETGAFDQATDVLREALEGYELTDDTSKELMYRLGIAHQSAGRLQEAKEVFGKLMRIDYNYANGDVRRRVDELNKGG
jgi:hypothetical protein